MVIRKTLTVLLTVKTLGSEYNKIKLFSVYTKPLSHLLQQVLNIIIQELPDHQKTT